MPLRLQGDANLLSTLHNTTHFTNRLCSSRRVDDGGGDVGFRTVSCWLRFGRRSEFVE